MDAVEKIARTVLYEGYVLWPYRRSALKNRQRWTLGGVYPEAFSKESGESDPWTMQTECILEAETGAGLDVSVRFLHVVERQVYRVASGDGADGDPTALVAGPNAGTELVDGVALEPVDELVVGDERYLTWEEATEREVTARGLPVSLLPEPYRMPIMVAAGREVEWLNDPAGRRIGALVRSWRSLEGVVVVLAERMGAGVDGKGTAYRLSVRVQNTTPWVGGSRAEALRATFVSAHTVLRLEHGAFVSLTDPPAEFRRLVNGCRNIGAWPVLVGKEGDRSTMLSSPIILYDYPQVAPESPGDLFDGTEIDQLLILNILGLTEEEQREVRATDPRARAILDRCASLSPEELQRLHGAVREFRSVWGAQP